MPFLNQSEIKPKAIMTCLHVFSRSWWRLHVFASSSDWFIGLSASVVIGQSNYTQLKTALKHLNYIIHVKPFNTDTLKWTVSVVPLVSALTCSTVTAFSFLTPSQYFVGKTGFNIKLMMSFFTVTEKEEES